MFGTAFCNGMGLGGWAVMIAFWAGFLGLIVWAVTRIFPTDQPHDDSRAELDRRFAAGEIDLDTYRSVRNELTGPVQDAAARRR